MTTRRPIVADSASGWHALRTEISGPFGLPSTADAWRAEADGSTEHAARARSILGAVAELRGDSLASYGVGNAFLEHQIATLEPAWISPPPSSPRRL